jgi:hypothetical protein
MGPGPETAGGARYSGEPDKADVNRYNKIGPDTAGGDRYNQIVPDIARIQTGEPEAIIKNQIYCRNQETCC